MNDRELRQQMDQWKKSVTEWVKSDAGRRVLAENNSEAIRLKVLRQKQETQKNVSD